MFHQTICKLQFITIKFLTKSIWTYNLVQIQKYNNNCSVLKMSPKNVLLFPGYSTYNFLNIFVLFMLTSTFQIFEFFFTMYDLYFE